MWHGVYFGVLFKIHQNHHLLNIRHIGSIVTCIVTCHPDEETDVPPSPPRCRHRNSLAQNGRGHFCYALKLQREITNKSKVEASWVHTNSTLCEFCMRWRRKYCRSRRHASTNDKAYWNTHTLWSLTSVLFRAIMQFSLFRNYRKLLGFGTKVLQNRAF